MFVTSRAACIGAVGLCKGDMRLSASQTIAASQFGANDRSYTDSGCIMHSNRLHKLSIACCMYMGWWTMCRMLQSGCKLCANCAQCKGDIRVDLIFEYHGLLPRALELSLSTMQIWPCIDDV
jgi:hypothetical protein